MGSHVAGLAPALARAGVEVHVITPRPPDFFASANLPDAPDVLVCEPEVDGVHVYPVLLAEDKTSIYNQAQKTNQALEAKGRALLASQGPFDLIHAHDWLVVFAAHQLKHTFRLPLVATIHATERGRERGGILHTELQRNIHGAEWWLVYEAWRVIACSHHMAREVQTYFHAPAEKIDVVPNGIASHSNGRFSEGDLAICRSRYAAHGQRIVFAVGRLVYEKGFHLLVAAVPHILSEFPDTQFVIAGRGPEALHLAQQASRLGVDDHVTFPGFISDEERDCLYRVAACAVFPSLYEPFGIVALEAMAAGCPVVVSEVGGLREVVHHGKTGITVYPDDVRSIAWGVLRVLRHPMLSEARAREARQMVRLAFNWDRIATQTIPIYQRILDERQRIEW
jgi:glycogen(starch) synthase